ncbi:MAG: hypothetical protein AB7Q17_07525 [Phycisphaerae bacterium]
MRRLAIGIFAEGPTDIDFLSPVARRIAIAFLTGRHHPAEIAEPYGLPGRPQTDLFRDTIQRHATLDIVIVHTDGGGDPSRARRERISRWFSSVSGEHQPGWPVLGAAVPVHEIEAWMIWDLSAIRRALGTRRSQAELGLPQTPQEVEANQDPKLVLRTMHEIAIGKRRARKLGQTDLYRSFGSEVDSQTLARLPAFRQFRDDFHRAIESRGF